MHRRIRQNTRRWNQGTFQGPLPHTPTQLHHRPSHGPQPIQYCAQGSQQPSQNHQGGHVYLCRGPPTKQKPWKVPASPRMGPSTSGITNTSAQANQPTIQHHNHLNPPTGPPPPITFTPLPLTPKWGTTPILFPYGKYTHVS